jgi:hypothetical protein
VWGVQRVRSRVAVYSGIAALSALVAVGIIAFASQVPCPARLCDRRRIARVMS